VAITPEHAELLHLRARVHELEAAQRQLEIYAEDLRRTFSELRRQLRHMNELHRISTVIGSVLEPGEVMARTLEGVGRLVANQASCIYLLDGCDVIRTAAFGEPALLPAARMPLDDATFGPMLTGADSPAVAEDGRTLIVVMRASGVVIGALYLVRAFGAPLTDDDRKLADLVAAEAAAAIQNARLYEQTQRLATTDPLTGLANHRFFRESLALEIARADRLGYALGLLMIDVDNFKRVNDTFGHPVGDDVLRDIAQILGSSLRQTDVAARYGGEEFAILLPGLGARGVRAVGEKLRRAVRALQPLVAEGVGSFPISVSVGGVSAAHPKLNGIDLVRVADSELYEAKRRGRNSVCVAAGSYDDDQPPPEMNRHEQAHSPAR
jgi:diguanylate cyclase (GGDEF)-like protein